MKDIAKLQDKIIQQLRFHRITGLDEEECANNIIVLIDDYNATEPSTSLPSDELPEDYYDYYMADDTLTDNDFAYEGYKQGFLKMRSIASPIIAELQRENEELKEHFGTQPREWWMELKKWDKFLFRNQVKTFNGIIEKSFGNVYLGNEESTSKLDIDYCQPYTEPSPIDKLKDSLTPQQRELIKQIPELFKTLEG